MQQNLFFSFGLKVHQFFSNCFLAFFGLVFGETIFPCCRVESWCRCFHFWRTNRNAARLRSPPYDDWTASLNCISFYFNCNSKRWRNATAPCQHQTTEIRIKFELFQRNVITVSNDDDTDSVLLQLNYSYR